MTIGVPKLLTYLGLLVGAFGLVLQFAISIPSYLAAGRWLPDALITFFSFYTILTNIALVLIYLSQVTAIGWLRPFRSPVVRAMMVAVMVLVCGFYHLLLADLWDPEGLFRVADVTLHYVTPILYLVWWLFAHRHGELGYTDIPAMLLPTLVYFLWVLARGAVVGEYPYPVLAANELGYGAVVVNALFIAAFLAVGSMLVIAVDRLLAGRQAIAE
ncbi:hypothetical protein VE25_17285 [Devosia geojensis]|uniref:Pr6Pr family membrane protein n=1 Tax=Devosia geojensis TaxID=443610 RepID=A0A0F5FNS2_9HYPH|nr:Pr6Pr family membrane protein [Devosia geojensis]KKB10496.1 hypothetical protein VE25_17285 [Devosia geojensis]